MSENTREHLDSFWELMDEILNAVLFLLIGLEILVLTIKGSYLIAGLMMIPVALALSIPGGTGRDALITVIYTVAVFSVLVQGLTVERMAASKKLTK